MTNTNDRRTPTLREAVEVMIEASKSSHHTQMPGRVEFYDISTQRASVQPLVKRGYRDEDGNRQTDTIPIITDVPIVFMGTATESLTAPVSKGDLVWIQFSELSLDKWLSGKLDRVTDPEDERRFTLNDAVAFPWAIDPDVASGAWVLRGNDIRLGSSTVTDRAALKSELDDLKSIIASWTPVANDGGSSLKAEFSGWSTAGSQKVVLE